MNFLKTIYIKQKTKNFRKLYHNTCNDVRGIIDDYLFQLDTVDKFNNVLLELKENYHYEIKYLPKANLYRSRLYFKNKPGFVEYYGNNRDHIVYNSNILL